MAAVCGRTLASWSGQLPALNQLQLPATWPVRPIFESGRSTLRAQRGGVPFELNSRAVLRLRGEIPCAVLAARPRQGDHREGNYKDHENSVTATLDFPVGTVIAKTFAFRDDTARAGSRSKT